MSRLDFLIVWHRTIALYAQRALEGTEPLCLQYIELGEPARCAIGHWIAVQEPDITSRPAFTRLVQCHRTYHQIAGRLLQERLADRSSPLDATAREQLQQASAAITETIGVLIEQLDIAQIDGVKAASEPFWDDGLLIGIDLIDQQHKAIAELASRIARKPETTLNSEAGVDFLTDFYRLVAFHFDTEEQLMAGASLSAEWQQAHIDEHSALLDKIVAYSYDQTRGRNSQRVAEIMQDLLEIIVGHVIRYDVGLKKLVQPPVRAICGEVMAGDHGH